VPVMLENAIKPRIREDKILRFLVEGTVSETGSEFFRALARNLSEALQTHGAWITEYLPETRRLRALAFWLNGGFLEHFEHAIDGTPCQPVIETKSRAHFPERLLEFFPNDPDLAALGAVSYMGTPLLDADGTLLGHLAVLDNRGDDIFPLAEAFGRRFADRMGRRFEELTDEDKRLLKAYSWPGNAFANCKTLLSARSSCLPVANSISHAQYLRRMAVNRPRPSRLVRPLLNRQRFFPPSNFRNSKSATCFAR